MMKVMAWSQKVCGFCRATSFKIMLLLLAFVTGCASHNRSETLFDTYTLYTYKIQERDYDYVLEDLLTRSMKNRGIGDASDFPDYFPVLMDLPGLLVNKEKHFEMRDGNFGCLTLNGFDRFDQPAVIKMEFGWEQERWKLDYVSVDYLDSPAEFRNSAVCPKRRS